MRLIDADRIDMNQVKVFDYKEQKWVLICDIPTVTEEEIEENRSNG